MNNTHRKTISDLIDRLKELQADLEAIYDEEQEYLDNMPENLQASEYAVENLDFALSSIQEAMYYMTEATA